MAKKSKKPVLGLNALLRVVAALAGVVAFIMMFLNQIEIHKVIVNNDVVIGTYGMQTFFGDPDSLDAIKNGSVVPFIGYILAVVGGIAGAGALFVIKDKKIDKLVVAVAALLMVAAAVMIFMTSAAVKSANSDSLINYDYKMLFAPVFGGIMAAVGAAANVVSLILKK